LAEIEAEIPDIPDELPRVPFERDASKDAIDADFKRLQDDMDSDDYFTFVRREDHSKITSASYLTVDQGNACAALTTTEAEVKIMPDPEFTLAPGTNGLVVIGPGDCRHYGLL
jgi:hypothetical protein